MFIIECGKKFKTNIKAYWLAKYCSEKCRHRASFKRYITKKSKELYDKKN